MAHQTISTFVASLKHEMRLGRVTPQTEHHLRRELSGIGWHREDALHAIKVDEEIARLETQARVLRTLRNEAFGTTTTTEVTPVE
jgi:hypothetical protein